MNCDSEPSHFGSLLLKNATPAGNKPWPLESINPAQFNFTELIQVMVAFHNLKLFQALFTITVLFSEMRSTEMRILCNACGAPPAGDFGAGGKRGTRNFLLQSLHDHIRVGYVLPIQFDEWHSPLRTNL
jgi:hypothetical protein